MLSLPDVLRCALIATCLWTAVGLPVALGLVRRRRTALALAPALGWAVHGVLALPLLTWLGCTAITVTVVAGVSAAAALAAAWRLRHRAPASGDEAPVPSWTFAAAALAAVLPALALMPKAAGSGVTLAPAMFDHAKIALVDAIARQGLPVVNPFFDTGDRPFGYYYLWHFTAAELALVARSGGWAADAALTWFTAFASQGLMLGLAVHLGRRGTAAAFVAPLSLAANARPVLAFLLGPGGLDRLLAPYPGLGAWLIQATWPPQHLAAGSCVVLAALVLGRLARATAWPLVLALALLAAAAFESSTWVGGVTLVATLTAAALVLLARGDRGRVLPFLVQSGAAAGVAAILVLPLVAAQAAATAARGTGLPLAFHPYEVLAHGVLGTPLPAALRRLADLPAYWLLLLPIELPAIYPAAVAALALLAATDGDDRRRDALALGAVALASLAVSWLLVSTLLNNDLGWRALIPALLILNALAAAGIARWLAAGRWLPLVAALALAGAGLVQGAAFAGGNLVGRPTAEAAALAAAPELWAAVRRHTAPGERVADNPLMLADATPWPVNIGWALLADRPSCYAGWPLALPFVPEPRARIDAIEGRFQRIFAGNAVAGDMDALVDDFGCRLAVVAPGDGAWDRDPFAASPRFRLVEDEPGRWRLYAALPRANGPRANGPRATVSLATAG